MNFEHFGRAFCLISGCLVGAIIVLLLAIRAYELIFKLFIMQVWVIRYIWNRKAFKRWYIANRQQPGDKPGEIRSF